VAGPTVVHKVKSKLGYTEMHTTAPGFGEEVRADESDCIAVILEAPHPNHIYTLSFPYWIFWRLP